MANTRPDYIPGTLDGFVLLWKRAPGKDSSNSMRKTLEAEFLKVPEITRIGRYLPSTWSAFSIESNFPLQKSDETLELPSYLYTFLIRYNSITGHVIIASSSQQATRNIIDTFINRQVVPNLLPIQILIADLAKDLVFSNTNKFKMTSFSGDFIEGGADVRTMILYGDDLGNASFVEKNMASVSAKQVGVRERDSLREDVRIGANGNLRFYNRNGDGLLSLQRCLSYVNDLELYVYPSI